MDRCDNCGLPFDTYYPAEGRVIDVDGARFCASCVTRWNCGKEQMIVNGDEDNED